jgi:hypothetical protein
MVKALLVLACLQDAADVVEAGLGQVGVLVAREHGRGALPDRLVAVHARAVVAEHGFGMKQRGLAVGLRHLWITYL